jgi:hypothetical protein
MLGKQSASANKIARDTVTGVVMIMTQKSIYRWTAQEEILILSEMSHNEMQKLKCSLSELVINSCLRAKLILL